MSTYDVWDTVLVRDLTVNKTDKKMPDPRNFRSHGRAPSKGNRSMSAASCVPGGWKLRRKKEAEEGGGWAPWMRPSPEVALKRMSGVGVWEECVSDGGASVHD